MTTRALWVLIGSALLTLAGGSCWHIRTMEHARQVVRDSITTASAQQRGARRDTVRLTAARVDTVLRTITRQATRVDTVALRIADTVRVAFPDVDTLVVESQALTGMVDVLRADVMTERRAREADVVGLGTVLGATQDSLHVEQRRPRRTWRTTLGTLSLGVVLGLVAR